MRVSRTIERLLSSNFSAPGAIAMLPNKLNFFLKQVYKGSALSLWNHRFCSSVATTANDKDPGPIFFDRRVQELLFKLTRIDYEKVFKPRKDGTPLSPPRYKFMTDKQLQAAQERVKQNARKRLQMPPQVKPRDDTVSVLSKDYALQGYDTSNYVFTDISFGNTNRNRLIVVREVNGVLRHANSNERHRMNQIYFPINGREIHTPRMFHDPHFSDLLHREEFEFLLDRACLQFDPDEPEYHTISKQVYDRVIECKKFDSLRSTRHFGPLVFHMVSEKNVGPLMKDLISNERIDEAAALVELYHCFHPETEILGESKPNDAELIKGFLETHIPDSERAGMIKALDAYLFMEKEKKELEERVKEAHGLSEEPNRSTDEPNT